MNSKHGHAIPAANLGDTDLVALAEAHPGVGQEAARLEDLVSRGESLRDLPTLTFEKLIAVAEDSEVEVDLCFARNG